MAITRGTALVATIARVVQLTGRTDLANFEADSELTVAELLVTASDMVHDRIEKEYGADAPARLSNQTRYETTVAWLLLALLTNSGMLALPTDVAPPTDEQGRADPWSWGDSFYTRVAPTFSSGEEPGGTGESVPFVGNFDSGHVYGPVSTRPKVVNYSKQLPNTDFR